ncbi:hypothetical protein [Sphingobacterium hungaricum]
MEIKENKQQSTVANKPTKKDNSKVYFFAIAIAALIFTNIYFYIKFKYSGEKLYTVTLQKENLQIEIDRIEAELDNLKNQELPATEQSAKTEQSARVLINDLRAKLEDGDFTEEEYLLAKEEISGLKGTVSQLKEEMNSLKIRNAILSNENVDMENKISGQSPQNSSKGTLSAPKSTKVSALKVSNIHINAVQLKKDGDVETQSRARRTDKLQINFSIAENSLANMGKKEVYVRIINPKGNLIADPNNLFFVHGEKLQYTFKQTINFTNNGEEYQFMWNDTASNDFSKGAYTVLLYTDNTIMGRSSIVLK